MDPSSLASEKSVTRQRPRVACISGHIVLPEDVFRARYKGRLVAAIEAGDAFVLSNAGGADTLALQYLLDQMVDPSRIKVYLHTPPASRQKRSNQTLRQIDELRTGRSTLEKYREQGLSVQVIDGWHTQRDAAMTSASDYNILWVRAAEEATRLLYGPKYRADRVNGPQKNLNRRTQVGRFISAEVSVLRREK